MDQIQNASQLALGYNQQEYERTVSMRLQGINYIPQYKSIGDYMPPEFSIQGYHLTIHTR